MVYDLMLGSASLFTSFTKQAYVFLLICVAVIIIYQMYLHTQTFQALYSILLVCFSVLIPTLFFPPASVKAFKEHNHLDFSINIFLY